MLKKLNPDWLIFLLFLTLVHLLYARTVQAGFVTDFTGLQERLEGAPFSDFLTCFGFPALHQVTNFFLFIFYKLFKTNGLPWYLVFTSLHVANAFLGYRLAQKIFTYASFSEVKFPALAAGLLFLLNPYQAEAVIWKVCFNFLLCSLLMLSSLLCWLRFLENERRASFVWSLVFFGFALFTFELALATPFLAAALRYSALQGGGATLRPEGRSTGKRLLFIFYLLLPFYFFLNKLMLGAWVGHYGEAVHLKFDPAAIGSNLLKYFSKYFAFWRDMPHGWKEVWMTFCDRPSAGYAVLALGGLALLAFIFFIKKIAPRWRAVCLCFLLFFVALAPVSNLYVAWILQGENDRYGYLASLFFFMGIAAFLWQLPKMWRYGFFALLLMLSVFFTHRITVYWQNSARIFYSLLEDFRWQDAPEVYVLAFPENYRGIPLFKDFSRKDLALRHALKYAVGREPKGKIYQIAQYNVSSPEDGLSAQADSLHHFSAEFNQWGNWWWRHGIGTGDYETEQYIFKTAGNGCKLELKKPTAGAVVIYADRGNWKELP